MPTGGVQGEGGSGSAHVVTPETWQPTGTYADDSRGAARVMRTA